LRLFARLLARLSVPFVCALVRAFTRSGTSLWRLACTRSRRRACVRMVTPADSHTR